MQATKNQIIMVFLGRGWHGNRGKSASLTEASVIAMRRA